MDSDLGSLKDDLHTEVVAIPNGLFRRQSTSVYPIGRKAEAVEADPARFDVREVVKTPARAAKAASIDIGRLQRSEVGGVEYPASLLSIIDERGERAESPIPFEGGSPVHRGDSVIGRPGQATTHTSQDCRRSRKSSSVIPPSAWRPGVDTKPREPDGAAPDDLTDQSYIFRDLSSFSFGQGRQPSNRLSFFYTGGNSTDNDRFKSADPKVSRRVTIGSPNLSQSQDAATRRPRAASAGTNAIRKASAVLADQLTTVRSRVRRSSMASLYEKAKVRQEQLKRSTWAQLLFEYSMYLLLIASVYFVLVGMPLWRGVVWYIYVLIAKKFVIVGGSAIFISIAAL